MSESDIWAAVERTEQVRVIHIEGALYRVEWQPALQIRVQNLQRQQLVFQIDLMAIENFRRSIIAQHLKILQIEPLYMRSREVGRESLAAHLERCRVHAAQVEGAPRQRVIREIQEVEWLMAQLPESIHA